MRGSESPLVVFVSSVMKVENLNAERQACRNAIDSIPIARSWLFEYSPASADTAEGTYLEKVDQCDIFVLILGTELTDPVAKEYDRALTGGTPRLLFVRSGGRRTPRAEEWLRQRTDVKWARFSNCDDLAEQVKAAVSDELIRAYRRLHLRSEDFDAIAQELRSEPVTFMVRTIESAELGDVTETLPELQKRYPDFREWVNDKAVDIARGRAEAYVASLGGQNAGFALVSHKGPGVRKISTLFIRETFRGEGIGPRLLFGVIERASRDKIEKLYVTLSEELRDRLEPLLDQYGFSVEGVSARRYKSGSWEWVWSKRLLYGCLRPRHLQRFVEHYMFQERGFIVENAGRGMFVARQRYSALGQPSGEQMPLLVVTASGDDPDTHYRKACRKARELGLALIFVSIEPLSDPCVYGTCFDSLALEARFFPLYVERNTEGLIIPIQERFAQMLIPRSDEPQFLMPTRVQLRTDNVYYRWPSVFRELTRGSPLFFYETQRRQGQSRLIGEGKLLEYAVDKPEELLARYGNLGVYTLEDVRGCTIKSGENSGKALALCFDWYREVPAALTRQQIEEVVPTFDPTTARRLQPMDILELRRRIGWNVNALSFR